MSAYREFFDRRLDRLEEHLETMVGERGSAGDTAGVATTRKGSSNDAGNRGRP
jgi:hypothetical protein